MKWSISKSLRLKRSSKKKRKRWKSKLMTFKKEFINSTKTLERRKMNAKSSEKSSAWSKSRAIFSSKIIRPWRSNTLRISKSGPSFVRGLILKWKSISSFTHRSFQLILLNETIFMLRVVPSLKNLTLVIFRENSLILERYQ